MKEAQAFKAEAIASTPMKRGGLVDASAPGRNLWREPGEGFRGLYAGGVLIEPLPKTKYDGSRH
ncbi:MAG: hypothetical protein AVDCRST_MAG56-2192 [uncultured Cytophagales bacterium]|uniref:Uncharacterized protein n=1 Tax=uncultured Cytophagales bacterium TaxID=158755 RepID=A0A6J4IND9_9SPHI|nr:MAG: hypothetical protein AVDCRST_MAG56-2192 [uncultured Cytophagales bacterium]